MALVVFLRGVNVGGHRTFRPSVLAKQLRDFDVVNVGAAGTFVVRKPGAKAKLLAKLAKRLPFETQIMLCDGRDLLKIEKENPFGSKPAPAGVVRFVCILAKAVPAKPPAAADLRQAAMPMLLPPTGRWLVRIIACDNRFAFGEYRRDMKTINYLGQFDKLLGVPVTVRNWNTIAAIVKVLKVEGKKR